MRSPEEIYIIVCAGLFAIALCGAGAFSLLWSALVILARSAHVPGAPVDPAAPDYQVLGAAALDYDDPALVTPPLRWQ